MKYAQFNGANDLCARYDSDIHGDAVPADAVKISDELFWQTINEVDGVWNRDPKTGAITKNAFPPPTDEQIATSARAQRNALLAACDWVSLRAAESGQPMPAEWIKYRQALRDIPAQKNFLTKIKWPVVPEA